MRLLRQPDRGKHAKGQEGSHAGGGGAALASPRGSPSLGSLQRWSSPTAARADEGGGRGRSQRARSRPPPVARAACARARAAEGREGQRKGGAGARALLRDPFHGTKDVAGISALDLKWRRRAPPSPSPSHPARAP